MERIFPLAVKYRKQLVFVLALIILFFLIRASHTIRSTAYDHAPETNFLDEYTNVWHGLSIRTTGVPAAWSDLRAYWDFKSNRPVRIKNANQGLDLEGFNISVNHTRPTLATISDFPEPTIRTAEFNFGGGPMDTSLMQPYLDHPPFGAIVLSLLVPKQQDTFNKITPLGSRKTSVWIANLTTVLIFLLAYQLYKNLIVGLMAAAIYASAPTFLLTSRMALLENVLVPAQLLSLNLLVLATSKLTSNLKLYRLFLCLSGVAAGLSFLSKTPGLAVILAGVIILKLYKEKFKNILFFLLPALLVSSVYLVWGMILAPDLFPKLLAEQSTKRIFVGSLNFITAAFKFGLKGFPIDGWWFGGFLSLIFLKFNKQFIPLVVSTILMLFTILFTGASSFPWYFIPLIPFLVIATANLFWETATNPTVTKVLIIFLVFFSSTYFWAWGVSGASPNFTHHEQQFTVYKIMLSFFFLAAVAGHFLYKRSGLFRAFWLIGVILLVYVLIKGNFKSIYYMLPHWGTLIDNYSPNWKL